MFRIRPILLRSSLCIALAGAFFLPPPSSAAEQTSRIRTRVVPAIFSTDNLGLSLGVGGIAIGVGQPQAALFGMGFASKNNSKGFSLGAVNYRIPKTESWYLTGFLYDGDLPEYGYFLTANPGYSVRGNGSALQTDKLGLQSFTARLQARWVLPIGAAKEPGFSLVGRSFLPRQAQGPVGFNPLTSGISSLKFEWEQQSQHYTDGATRTQTGAQVLRAQIDWDNTGSRIIPRAGTRINLSSSWGFNDYGRGNWRLNELDVSGFIPLSDPDEQVSQQVLALNLYAADTPSWDASALSDRPPEYLGARLGGLNRLRGYRSSRFYDRSAWLYRAEYRLIPKWQPLTPLFAKIGYRVPWWQFTVFADAGRVAPSFDLNEFHKDMKTSAGVGLRILAEGLLVRIDFGRSQEESTTIIMIDQSF